jgi:hypothetical protein
MMSSGMPLSFAHLGVRSGSSYTSRLFGIASRGGKQAPRLPPTAHVGHAHTGPQPALGNFRKDQHFLMSGTI